MLKLVSKSERETAEVIVDHERIDYSLTFASDLMIELRGRGGFMFRAIAEDRDSFNVACVALFRRQGECTIRVRSLKMWDSGSKGWICLA